MLIGSGAVFCPQVIYLSLFLTDKDRIVNAACDCSIRVNRFHNIANFMRVVKIAGSFIYSIFPVIIVSLFFHTHIFSEKDELGIFFMLSLLFFKFKKMSEN